MTDQQWETVDVPQGAFVGWGSTAGQHVTGKVLSYSPTGGSDFNGDPCPLLVLELIEQAASFNKAGERTDYPAGEFVNLTVGQTSLKAALQKASPDVGDLLKITMTGTSVTKKGNTIKNFEFKIARGAGQAQQPAPAAGGFGGQPQAQPPF